MSLITRCPDCATLFKVEPEQLSVAQGWVRCGQCDHIFDASLSVVSVPVLQPAPKSELTPEIPRVDLEGLLRRKDVVADSVTVVPPAFASASQSTLPSRVEPGLNGPLRTEPEHLSALYRRLHPLTPLRPCLQLRPKWHLFQSRGLHS